MEAVGQCQGDLGCPIFHLHLAFSLGDLGCPGSDACTWPSHWMARAVQVLTPAPGLLTGWPGLSRFFPLLFSGLLYGSTVFLTGNFESGPHTGRVCLIKERD